MSELLTKPKYRKWMEREIKKGYKEEDLSPTLQFFAENITKFNNRDIYAWDGRDLENFIKENNLKSARKEREEDKSNAQKIFEDSNWLVVIPNDKEACSYYGSGTKWCITMTSGDYFQSYRDKNYVFCIVIDKNAENQDKWGKVCIAILRDTENEPQKIEYYSSDDVAHTENDLPEKLKSFLEIKKAA
jgi:hypothetical protein